MSGFEVDKGSTLYQVWADLFLLWRNYGNIHSTKDRADWAEAAYQLCQKYCDTPEWDLCREIIDGMMTVINLRLEKEGALNAG